jgi:hypothetical protein
MNINQEPYKPTVIIVEQYAEHIEVPNPIFVVEGINSAVSATAGTSIIGISFNTATGPTGPNLV